MCVVRRVVCGVLVIPRVAQTAATRRARARAGLWPANSGASSDQFTFEFVYGSSSYSIVASSALPGSSCTGEATALYGAPASATCTWPPAEALQVSFTVPSSSISKSAAWADRR
jgi:hypothetical protein